MQADEKSFETNIARLSTHPWLSRPAPEVEVVIGTALLRNGFFSSYDTGSR
jgi:hypothetical protein